MAKSDLKLSLDRHAERLNGEPLTALANARSSQLIEACGWSVSAARHYLDNDAEETLISFGEASELEPAIKRLFSAEIVNPSENRPALHWALRTGQDAIGKAATVRDSLSDALAFAEKHSNGDRYKAIVHIGIGGSDFGPRLIYDAFTDLASPNIELRLCANVDPFDLERALTGLDPETTLVIGVSKSFGTEETLYNLGRARTWLGEHASGNLAVVTANPERAKKWADGADVHLFDMPLSVGGRFSMWSAASLCCMITLGADNFRKILSGARAMDEHVKTAPLAQNLPARLALLDYWNASVRQQPMRVALAYASRLRMLPTYLQQLEMESNGKTVSPTGENLEGRTAPALWGGEGSIGQHSYHQWLHQGSQSVPTEFILALDAGAEPTGQRALVAHCLAQAEVLANGRSLETIQTEEPELPLETAKQKVHPGGHPSTLMICSNFGPKAFGSLLALFEHRTYLAGVLWGLNSFDQWGVERGKVMAGQIDAALSGDRSSTDTVTETLINLIKD